LAELAAASDEHALSFDPFRLLPERRLLLEGDKPVRLGSRALDILVALVERPGELVGKDELMARAWRDTFVEEGNLKFQIGALRRALGDGRGGRRYIATSPGQGYRFVAPVTVAEMPLPAVPSPTPIRRNDNLPARLTRLIGRADAVRRIAAQIERHRLLTIVGPGGIGKTSVALAAAAALIDAFVDGAWLIDLAPLADPRLVPSALATVLGFDIRSDNPVSDLVGALKDRRLVLVLDNCTHVIEAVAALAAAILRGAADVHILATSREPLRVEAEHVQRLPPLSSGSPSDRFGAAEALAFPAVELFVERTAECLGEFELTDPDAPIVAEICRKLDGIPLAIELAAARVETFGVRGLAARLDDRFRLLSGGWRSAPPRHRTLRATLDWSYEILSENERVVLRRLAIFAGGFTLDDAAELAADAAIPKGELINLVAELIDKSLVVVEQTASEPRLRLLDTTRAYALQKLADTGECEPLARRHAEYYRNLFERAEGEAAARPADEWLADYAQEIDNLRASLDWAFSPNGDPRVGMALTAAAVPLWMRLSLLEECRSRAKQALSALGTAGTRDPREEMRLHAALGASTPEAPEMGAAFTKVLDIAESLGDTDYQLRALRGLYFDHIGNSRYRAALPFAQKFHDLATSRSDPSDQLFGERMMGVAKHFVGDQISARRHLEQVLTHHAFADHTQDVIRFQIDLRLSARVFLARVLWLQGFSDQAVRTAEISIGEAQTTGHAISLCYALSLAACPIALWVGNLVAAANYTAMLLDHSRRHSLPLWSAFGSRFQSVVDIKGGDLETGLQLLQTGLDEIAGPNVSFRFLTGLAELAEALGDAGRIAEGLALVEAGIQQSEGGWLTPELLRLKGELFLLQSSSPVSQTAEDLFRQALDGARRQEALSWELRAATSLARLLRDRDRIGEARDLLAPIYARFTEGFGTADLREAKRLIDALP
jgi:predicted ATPase/DNA-binding winged helix-turn-helix (wHTH) protein